MKEGDVVLKPVPQADGSIKNRSAVLSSASSRLIKIFLFAALAHNYTYFVNSSAISFASKTLRSTSLIARTVYGKSRG